MPPQVALGLSVTAVLAVLGITASLLPASFTGSGTPAKLPAAAVAALAPGASGGVPDDRTATRPAPSTTSPSLSVTPAQTARTATKAAPKNTSTTSASRASGLEGQENEVIRLVNIERGKAGCGSLRLNTLLRTAIRLHVRELGTHGGLYISHVSDDGRTFVDRAKAQGYDDPGGENVARGQRDVADVMNSWMNSAGHRANILNCGFKAIGVGVTRGVDGTSVWGQLFGRS